MAARTSLRHHVIFGLTWFFFHLMNVLPLWLCRGLARGVGILGYYLVPRLRTVGMANLDRAYGDTLSRATKRRILLEAAQSMALVGAEFAHIPAQHTRGFAGRCRLSGQEHLPNGTAAVMISVHAGNWEWMVQFLSTQGYPVAGVARPMNHPAMEALVLRIRSTGIHSLPKEKSGNDLIRLLKEGYVTAVLIDQSPRDNAVPCTFLGAPCWATIAPVMLALRAKVPVVPVSQTREPDGAYSIQFHPPVPFVRTGDLRRDLIENTQRCQDAVEAIVREHPGQWLWFHRRWKTRPRLEEEWNARIERDRKRGAHAAQN